MEISFDTNPHRTLNQVVVVLYQIHCNREGIGNVCHEAKIKSSQFTYQTMRSVWALLVVNGYLEQMIRWLGWMISRSFHWEVAWAAGFDWCLLLVIWTVGPFPSGAIHPPGPSSHCAIHTHVPPSHCAIHHRGPLPYCAIDSPDPPLVVQYTLIALSLIMTYTLVVLPSIVPYTLVALPLIVPYALIALPFVVSSTYLVHSRWHLYKLSAPHFTCFVMLKSCQMTIS